LLSVLLSMAIKKRKQHSQLLIFLGVAFFATLLVSAIFFVKSDKSELKTLNIDGEILLTHGEDLPENFAENTTGTTRILANAGPAAFCEGDGKDGPRVQVIYASTPTTNQYNEMLGTIRSVANAASHTIDMSATKTRGNRVVRYVTGPGCMVEVANMTVSEDVIGSAGKVIYEAKKQGFAKQNRKYMILAEIDGFCGMSSVINDDSPSPNSAHNGNSYGVLGKTCYDRPGAFVHELMHGLGAVQLSAPNATQSMHCVDDKDQMCRKENDQDVMRQDCPDDSDESLLDCNDNDYFNTNPAPGSYLATHWNAATSPFLDNPKVKEAVPTTEPTTKPKKAKKKNKATKKQSGKKTGKKNNR
jgi:hypothetical protein